MNEQASDTSSEQVPRAALLEVIEGRDKAKAKAREMEAKLAKLKQQIDERQAAIDAHDRSPAGRAQRLIAKAAAQGLDPTDEGVINAFVNEHADDALPTNLVESARLGMLETRLRELGAVTPSQVLPLVQGRVTLTFEDDKPTLCGVDAAGEPCDIDAVLLEVLQQPGNENLIAPGTTADAVRRDAVVVQQYVDDPPRTLPALQLVRPDLRERVLATMSRQQVADLVNDPAGQARRGGWL